MTEKVEFLDDAKELPEEALKGLIEALKDFKAGRYTMLKSSDNKNKE